MKRLLCTILVLLLALSTLPTAGHASETESEIVYFEDGTFLRVTIAEYGTRASGTKTATKTYEYSNDSGSVLWKAVLSGTFTYTGTSTTCTASSCSVTVYDSSWYQVSKTVGKSGNTANATLTMGHKLLGVTITKKTVNMTLTCDANGNLS